MLARYRLGYALTSLSDNSIDGVWPISLLGDVILVWSFLSSDELVWFRFSGVEAWF